MDEAMNRGEIEASEERDRGAITWRQFDRMAAKYVTRGKDDSREMGSNRGELPRIDRQRSDHYAALHRRIRLLGGVAFTKIELQDARREVDAMWPHAVAMLTEVRVLQEVYPLTSDWVESQEVSWLANEVEEAVAVMESLRDRLVAELDEDVEG